MTGVQTCALPICPADIEGAFDRFAKADVDAVVVIQDIMFNREADRLARLTIARKLPTIFNRKVIAVAGGLISYGASNEWAAWRSAWYVDRILHGAKPGELPIEMASRFYMTVNMKTAKAIGLKISEAFLVRADEVIE